MGGEGGGSGIESRVARSPAGVAGRSPSGRLPAGRQQVASTAVGSQQVCGCPICDLLCVSAPVWRRVQGPLARPPGFLPAPCG
eukprot:2365350-Prymnesium_polylepis.1